MIKWLGEICRASNSCGLGILKNFYRHDLAEERLIPYKSLWVENLPSNKMSDMYKWVDAKGVAHYPSTGGGMGMNVAMFLNTQKEVYEILRGVGNIVYQSPVRFNENSGNEVFFVIYDNTKQEADIGSKWPW